LTDTSSGAGGTAAVPTGSGLSVTLASDTPASATIPSSASNAVFGKYNFTASADGAVAINNLTFKRTGVGATTEFQNLYLYEGTTRLTTGRSVNASTNLVIFNNIGYTVPAGTTKTLSLVADVAVSKTGSHAFEITAASDVSTSATVSGSFPVKANTMTLNATNVGRVVVTKGSNPSKVTAGGTEKELASFTLAVSSTEDAEITGVILYQAGSVTNSNITNLKLKQGSDTITSAASIPSNSKLVLSFDKPFSITKGNSKKFYLYGDVDGSARADQTIIFYMEANSDVVSKGLTYGYPLTVAIGGTDSAGGTSAGGTFDGASSGTQYTTTSIEAGDVTVAVNGPSAGYVAVNSNDVVLLKFSVTAQSAAEIRSLHLELHNELDSAAGDMDASDTTVTSNYITDIKITNTDTSAITWGAVDISSFSDSNATDAITDGIGYTFTNTVTLDASKTYNFQVTCDLTSSVSAGSVIKAVIGDMNAGNTFTSTAVKSTATNTYLTSIVPAAYSAGNNMTIRSNALALTRAAVVPLAQNVVRGAADVESASIIFDASTSGGDVKVTSLTLTGYVDGYSGTAGLSEYSTSTLTVKDLVSSIKIYERNSDGTATQLYSGSKSFDTSGKATFNSLNWVIPKESSKTLLVKATLANNSTILDIGEANVARFAIDIETASTDVSAESVDKGVSLTTTGDLPNGATGTAGAQVTVREAGTITAADGTKPVSNLVIAGTNSVAFDQVKFVTSYEPMKITKMRVKLNSGVVTNLSAATLTYKNSAGVTETKTQSFSGNNADFVGLDIYVGQSSYVYVDIGGNVKTITGGATPGGSTALIIDGTTGFEAVGAGVNSSTKLTAISTNGATTGNTMVVVKSKPTFATQTLSSTSISGGVEQTIYKFTVSANTGGSVSLKKIPFQINVSDSNAAMYLSTVRLKRTAIGSAPEATTMYATFINVTGEGYATSSDNGILNVAYIDGGYMLADNSNSRTVVAIFDSNNSYNGSISGGGDSKGEEIVQAGETRTYEVVATINGTITTGDSVSTYIPAEITTTFNQGTLTADFSNINGLLEMGGSTSDDYFMWSDMTSNTEASQSGHSANYSSSPSSDWYNGAFFTQASAASLKY